MRRVVASPGEGGRSFVSDDSEVPDVGPLWVAEPRSVGAIIGDLEAKELFAPVQPPPGASLWYAGELPPGKGMTPLENPPEGMDEQGFHRSNTVDLVYILSGKAILDLDQESVELQAGSVVVLEAVNHAWRNPGDEPTRLLDVHISCEAA